jgi:hypothetical protein
LPPPDTKRLLPPILLPSFFLNIRKTFEETAPTTTTASNTNTTLKLFNFSAKASDSLQTSI